MPEFEFIEGMEVAHIGNLSLKLYVKGAKYRNVKINEEPHDDPSRGYKKSEGQYFEGLQVEWWHNGEHRKDVFHSGLLVPWEIAMQGQEEAEKWRYNNSPKLFKKIEKEIRKSVS